METEGAYILIKDVNELEVYNQGIFVRVFGKWQAGVGGVIVSKISFELNIARNEIVTAKCEVWRRVSKILKAHGVKEVTKRKTLTR